MITNIRLSMYYQMELFDTHFVQFGQTSAVSGMKFLT